MMTVVEQSSRASTRRILIQAGVLAAVAGFIYFALLTQFSFYPFVDQGFGLVFNDMLLRLLRGDFTIDSELIKVEAFISNGKEYTYFGIFSALVRLPFLPFVDLETQPVSVITCTVAAAGCVFFYTASILTIAQNKVSGSIILGLLASVVFAGIPMYLMGTSIIYNEPILWAACLSAAYVFILCRHLNLSAELNAGSLSALAFISGLCIHARISTGAGLSLACALLILRSAWVSRSRLSSTRFSDFARAWRFLLLPVAILLSFSALSAYVNYMRWGNPLEFADLSKQYFLNRLFPDRLSILQNEGVTNPNRIWFGLQYYFAPVWAVPGNDGKSIFSDWMTAHLHGAEWPPTSLILTDGVWLALGVVGVRELSRKQPWTSLEQNVVLAATGLALPALLALMHIYMALRYREEFQPLIMLLGMYGLFVISRDAERYNGARKFLIPLAVGSIVFSQLTFLMPSYLGPTNNLDLSSVYTFYYNELKLQLDGLMGAESNN